MQMIKSFNLPLCHETKEEYGSWDELRNDLNLLGLDGVEGIWADCPEDFPEELLTGYHMIFFNEWLDLYHENYDALLKRFGSMQGIQEFYGGTDRACIINSYRKDLQRARSLGAKYVVFHISDVSMEECYTYSFAHTDEDVAEASIEIINELFTEPDGDMELLAENLWWPGMSFTRPEITKYVMDGINYRNKGIMLDTGHLLCSDMSIRNQEEGARYILKMLDKHGDTADYVHGIHLHQSISGDYSHANTGFVPTGFENKPMMERYCEVYSHLLRIDRHEPWSSPAAAEIVGRISPRFLTHELQTSTRKAKFEAVKIQSAAIEGVIE